MRRIVDFVYSNSKLYSIFLFLYYTIRFVTIFIVLSILGLTIVINDMKIIID